MRFRGRTKLAAGLFVLLSIYAAASGYFYAGLFNDDARHILAAKSLLSGSYRDISSPAAGPISNLLPGYPLILTVPMSLGSVKAAQYLSVILTAGAVLIIFIITKSACGPWAAALTALNPITVKIAGTVMSEPAFLFWTMISFALIKNPSGFPAYAILLWTAFGSWIRPEGLILLIILLPALTRRLPARNRMFFTLLSFSAAGLPYLRNILTAGTPAAYFQEIPLGSTLYGQLMAISAVLRHNIVYYYTAAPNLLTSFYAPENYLRPLFILSAAVFWFITIAGMKQMWISTRDESARERAAYALAFITLHLFWVNQSERYIFPVLPLLYEAFILGLRRLPARKFTPHISIILLTMMLAKDAMTIRASVMENYRDHHPPSETVSWIKENTKADDIFMAPYRESAYFLSGRKTMGYFYSPNPDYWRSWFSESKISYIWLDSSRELIAMAPSRKSGFNRTLKLIRSELSDTPTFKPVYKNAIEKQEIYKITVPGDFIERYGELKKAAKEINEGRLKNALKLLETLDRKKPPLKRVKFYLATTAMLLNDRQKAIKNMETAARIEPEFALAWKNLGMLYLQTGKTEEAKECFAKAENLYKDGRR